VSKAPAILWRSRTSLLTQMDPASISSVPRLVHTPHTRMSLTEPSVVNRRVAEPSSTEGRLLAPPAIAGRVEVSAVVPVPVVKQLAEPMIKSEDFQAERELLSSRMEEIHTQRVVAVKEVMKQHVEGVTQKVDDLLTMLKQHITTCEARFQRTESAMGAQLRQQGLEIEGARAQLQDLLEEGQGRDEAEQYTQVYGMLEGIQDDQKSLRRDISLQIEELVAKTLTAQAERLALDEAAHTHDPLLIDLCNRVVALEQRQQQREQAGADATIARSQMEVVLQEHKSVINDLRRHASDHAQTTDQLDRRLRDLEDAIQTYTSNQTSMQEKIQQESMSMYDLRQSLTSQSDQSHQLGSQLHHLDARMESLAQAVKANSASDFWQDRLNRAEDDTSPHPSRFLAPAFGDHP